MLTKRQGAGRSGFAAVPWPGSLREPGALREGRIRGAPELALSPAHSRRPSVLVWLLCWAAGVACGGLGRRDSIRSICREISTDRLFEQSLAPPVIASMRN